MVLMNSLMKRNNMKAGKCRDQNVLTIQDVFLLFPL